MLASASHDLLHVCGYTSRRDQISNRETNIGNGVPLTVRAEITGACMIDEIGAYPTWRELTKYNAGFTAMKKDSVSDFVKIVCMIAFDIHWTTILS